MRHSEAQWAFKRRKQEIDFLLRTSKNLARYKL